jgi:hypothetical protein
MSDSVSFEVPHAQCVMAAVLTFRFEVTVDETHQMEVLECGRDLGGIKACILFAHTFVRSGLKCSEELSSTAILHAEIQMILGLERVVQSDNKWMVAGRQNFLFGKCPFDLISLDHFFFAQDWDLLDDRRLSK